jgi:hypothetical protein
MKHWLATGLMGLMVALTAVRAEDTFSKAIRPEDFTAAELDKLSPEALARLDALVQAYKSGAVAKARAEAEAQAAKAAAAVAAAAAKAKEKEKADSPGFFAKAKVLLMPGTKIEYSELESRLVGNFTGWEGRKVFTLENGQHWQVANGGEYFSPPVPNPKVKISPATLGGFWMTIEGTGVRVRVKSVDD